MTKKPQEWDEKFADLVYKNVEKHKYFITNLEKCTQVDARVLLNSIYIENLKDLIIYQSQNNENISVIILFVK